MSTCVIWENATGEKIDYNEHLREQVSEHAQSNIATANAVQRAHEYAGWLLDIASTSTESDSAVLKCWKRRLDLSEHSLTAGLQEQSRSQSLDWYWQEQTEPEKNNNTQLRETEKKTTK